MNEIQYQLIASSKVEELQGTVNILMRDGWIPLGGPAVMGSRFYQAMTKPDQTGWVDLAPMVSQELR